jgi:cadmium resistance protein CadD (predicted permease)
MSPLPAEEIATGAALFAATNVDDLVILALLSALSQAGGRPRRWQIWCGQYAGFAVLAGVSLAAGRGLAVIPRHWLWPLALVPIGLGLVTLAGAVRSARRGERPDPPSPGGLAGVAALTIVGGADNLAVYTPFFATSDAGQTVVTLAVFAAGVAVWILAAWLLVRHARVTAAARRYGHWILPVALILVGLYTLQRTGALG